MDSDILCLQELEISEIKKFEIYKKEKKMEVK